MVFTLFANVAEIQRAKSHNCGQVFL